MLKQDALRAGEAVPLNRWADIKIPEGFQLTPEGVFRTSDDAKTSEKIAGPVWISAHTKEEFGETFGVVINWIDMKGEHGSEAWARDMLYGEAGGLAQRLARRGLAITPGKEQALKKYLGSFDADQWIRSTSRAGWLDSTDGELVFVHPNKHQGVMARVESEHVIFQPEQHSPTVATMRAQGTLDAWQKHVTDLCRGNPYLIFSLGASFAAPLLKFARTESGGFHFYGRSSRGKTTAMQVAASVWGCGADPSDAPDASYVQRWNTTGNALEALLAAHNDVLLVLDEIHTCDAKDFGRVIYNMAGGRGKARLDKESDLRAQRTWRTLFLSTGEIPSRQKIEEEGKKAHAGQLLRLVDIPTEGAIIADPHDMDPGQFAQALKRACGQYSGTAGIAFIKGLIEVYGRTQTLSDVVRNRIEACEKSLLAELPAEAVPEQQRVLKRFALVLVAGELACELKVLPFDKDDIAEAVRAVIQAWLADGANLPDCVRGAQAVQAFLHQHQSLFRNWQDDKNSVRDLAGYKKPGLFLFTPSGFAEACQDYNPAEVARELAKRGLLLRGEKDRFQSKHQVIIDGDQRRPRFFAVKDTIFEYDFAENAPDSEKSIGTDGTCGTISTAQ